MCEQQICPHWPHLIYGESRNRNFGINHLENPIHECAPRFCPAFTEISLIQGSNAKWFCCSSGCVLCWVSTLQMASLHVVGLKRRWCHRHKLKPSSDWLPLHDSFGADGRDGETHARAHTHSHTCSSLVGFLSRWEELFSSLETSHGGEALCYGCGSSRASPATFR